MRLFVLLTCAVLGFMISGCSALLYYPDKALFTDPLKFKHPPEDIYFMTNDGVKLHGWYFRSTTRPAKATLLLFHGNAQNLSTHFFNLYWLIDEGYDYFVFDYRGYGRSEGKPSPAGTVEDGKAALKWITEHKDPATAVVLFTQSLGGAVGLRVACDTPEPKPFVAIVADSTFVSYRKAAQSALAQAWLTWPLQPLGYLLMSDAFAPTDCVSHLNSTPILVVHGTEDHTVELSLGERLFELASGPKIFWRIEGGGHTDFLFRERFRYRQPFLAWLRDVTSGRNAR
jgi:fermentation-respiration switch protein FrsA (DUF1100 family)